MTSRRLVLREVSKLDERLSRGLKARASAEDDAVVCLNLYAINGILTNEAQNCALLETAENKREWMGIETISRITVTRTSYSFVMLHALHNPVQLVQKMRL